MVIKFSTVFVSVRPLSYVYFLRITTLTKTKSIKIRLNYFKQTILYFLPTKQKRCLLLLKYCMWSKDLYNARVSYNKDRTEWHIKA